MRVLMFLNNPLTNDPRVYNEAKTLIQAGHEVTVIAWDREKQNPPKQNWDGIEVVRLRTRLTPRHGVASWLWNGFNLLLWQRQACRQALELYRKEHFDVVHCHNFDTLSIGVKLKRKLNLPIVYDAHEIYGYVMARTFGLQIARIFLWLEKQLIGRVDAMITDGEGRKIYFANITDKPISIIMNCKPIQSLEYRPPDNENFTLLYIGILLRSRMLLELIEAVKEVPDVRCVIGGIGRPGYVELLKDECSKTANVTFLGPVPFDQVIPMTNKAHVVVCMINPTDPNNRLGMANKVGEAMVCGRPIICTKGTYSGEITAREQAGLVIENSVEALRRAIVKLRDDSALRDKLGKNALKAAITEYNWKKQEERLLALYQSL